MTNSAWRVGEGRGFPKHWSLEDSLMWRINLPPWLEMRRWPGTGIGRFQPQGKACADAGLERPGEICYGGIHQQLVMEPLKIMWTNSLNLKGPVIPGSGWERFLQAGEPEARVQLESCVQKYCSNAGSMNRNNQRHKFADTIKQKPSGIYFQFAFARVNEY